MRRNSYILMKSNICKSYRPRISHAELFSRIKSEAAGKNSTIRRAQASQQTRKTEKKTRMHAYVNGIRRILSLHAATHAVALVNPAGSRPGARLTSVLFECRDAFFGAAAHCIRTNEQFPAGHAII